MVRPSQKGNTEKERGYLSTKYKQEYLFFVGDGHAHDYHGGGVHQKKDVMTTLEQYRAQLVIIIRDNCTHN